MTARVGAARHLLALLSVLLLTALISPWSPTMPGQLDVAADRDDDDENGVADAEDSRPPLDDLDAVTLPSGETHTLRFYGPIRVLRDGVTIPDGVTFGRTTRPITLYVQGVSPGRGALVVRTPEREQRIDVLVHGITLESRDGALDLRTAALGITHGLPNDEAFVRDAVIADDAFRVHVESDARPPRVELRVVAQGDPSRRGHVALTAPLVGGVSRSLRLVASEIDLEAPLVGGRLLRAALRDAVEIAFDTSTGPVAQSVRVGRPPREDGPYAARTVALDVHVLDDPPTSLVRTRRDDVAAMTRRQITLANELFAPCAVAFVADRIAFDRAPVPSMISVGGEDGLHASGGEIRLRVGDRALPSMPTRSGERPVVIASRIAAAIQHAGFVPSVYALPVAERGHDASVDVIVRDAAGALVHVAAEDTDARLDVRVVTVALEDGLSEFDNATATRGTPEERALVLGLADAAPGTIGVFVIERFTRGVRVGEAFVPRDGGPLAGAVLLDLRALALTDVAGTLAHELAHVLLDRPLHPADLGRSTRTSLLATGAARGDLRGARRLSAEECAEIRRASAGFLSPSGPGAAYR